MCPKLVSEKLEKNHDIDSLVATHVYGESSVKAFDALKNRHNIKIIYDGAHAFNIKLGQKSILNFGDASSLSFHATKLFILLRVAQLFLKIKKILIMLKA